jgi:hypothetical protein
MGAEWTIEAELLASLIEVTDAVSWRTVMPHAGKSWKPPKHLEVTRPGGPRKRAKSQPPPGTDTKTLIPVRYVGPEGGE